MRRPFPCSSSLSSSSDGRNRTTRERPPPPPAAPLSATDATASFRCPPPPSSTYRTYHSGMPPSCSRPPNRTFRPLPPYSSTIRPSVSRGAPPRAIRNDRKRRRPSLPSSRSRPNASGFPSHASTRSRSRQKVPRVDDHERLKEGRDDNVWSRWRSSSASSSSSAAAGSSAKISLIETDPHRLSKRQKQIDFGKNTIGYDNYVKSVPKSARRGYRFEEPRTPDKGQKYSKRQWDGMIRSWRRTLHAWDDKCPPPAKVPEENAVDNDLSRSVARVLSEKKKPERDCSSLPVAAAGAKGADGTSGKSPVSDPTTSTKAPASSSTPTESPSLGNEFCEFADDDLL